MSDMQFQTAIPSRFRPHLFTIVMVVAVGTAATFSQLISRGGMISCGQIPIQEENYGWPMRSHHRVETFLPQGMQVQQEWHTFGIIVDVIASLIVIGSTCFVSERWLLKIPRQFRLIHLFALLTVAAIAFFVFVDEKTLLVLQSKLRQGFTRRDFGNFHWLFEIPMYFGFFSTIFTIGYGLRILARKFL